jgi:hypothetical protein
VAAVFMCSRRESSPTVRFATPDEAILVAERLPCGRGCESSHLVVWKESRRIRVQVFGGPRACSRAAAFAAAYPRQQARDLRCWRTPRSFNLPLREYAAMTSPHDLPPEVLQRMQDEAVRTAPGSYEEVGGAGQAAFEDHDLARRLRRTGDPLDKISADGHDQSAQALVDGEIATWGDDEMNPAVGVVDPPGVLPWQDVSLPPDDSGDLTGP